MPPPPPLIDLPWPLAFTTSRGPNIGSVGSAVMHFSNASYFVTSFPVALPSLFLRLTFASVPPCCLCPRPANGYLPEAGLRSDRAEMAFSALYGGVQLHFDNGSCV